MTIKTLYLLLILSIFSTEEPYQFSFSTITGQEQTLTAGAGKKIVIVAFNGLNPDISQLSYLDSLYQSDTTKYFPVAVPALDFDSSFSTADLKTLLIDSLHFSFTITAPMLVKKSNGESQSPLFKWLTNVSGNTHFDRDVEGEGQLFIISENGTLYSILERSTPDSLLTTALAQNIQQ